MMNNDIWDFAKKLWPIHRSLAGENNRKTLDLISQLLPDMTTIEYKSGKKVFDWVIPKEWVVKKAYIITPSGKKICDVKDNNLHILAYSESYNGTLSKEDLSNHLHYLSDQPDAIPYVTSYYEKNWGFCITYNQFMELEDGEYKVVIETDFKDGYMTIGELVVPGKSETEVLFSTYICHPSMANNEISGIVIQTYLAKWLQNIKDLHYTYRFVFLPETIGSIAYLEANLNEIQQKVQLGYVLSCIGDERAFSILQNKNPRSYSTRLGKYALSQFDKNYKTYDWRDRGSDERQYGSPAVGLDVCTIMRSKFGEYPEYHTSLDQLGKVVTRSGLQTSLKLTQFLVQVIEADRILLNKVTCEPMLSKHGLYPTLSVKDSVTSVKNIRDILDNADGSTSLLMICEKYELNIIEMLDIALQLSAKELLGLKRVFS